MKDDIKTLRKEIDNIDIDLMLLLAKRTDVVKKIGRIKKQQNSDPLDPKRRDTMIEAKTKLAEEYGLNKKFVSKLFLLIHDHAVELQEKLK